MIQFESGKTFYKKEGDREITFTMSKLVLNSETMEEDPNSFYGLWVINGTPMFEHCHADYLSNNGYSCIGVVADDGTLGEAWLEWLDKIAGVTKSTEHKMALQYHQRNEEYLLEVIKPQVIATYRAASR